jgi:hypothetical protein
LGEADDNRLSELTKVSVPQIKRCKILLTYDKKYQAMMMDTDTSRRIKANFFIELYPILDLYEKKPAKVRGGKTREELIQHFLGLYQGGKIPSVIHFRRILEANDYLRENGEVDEEKEWRFEDALKTLATSERHSIKKLFDPLTAEDKSVASAQKLCSEFLEEMRGLKVEHVVKRGQLRKTLTAVQSYVSELLTKLEG